MTTKLLIDRELLERELLSVLDFSESNLRRVVDHLIDVGYTRAALAAPVQGEAVAWARQCDLDESDPAIFVAREEVQESGYLVPLYTTPQPSAGVVMQELAVLREYRLACIAFNNSHGYETDTLEEAVEIERQAEERVEAAEKACWEFYRLNGKEVGQ